MHCPILYGHSCQYNPLWLLNDNYVYGICEKKKSELIFLDNKNVIQENIVEKIIIRFFVTKLCKIFYYCN